MYCLEVAAVFAIVNALMCLAYVGGRHVARRGGYQPVGPFRDPPKQVENMRSSVQPPDKH